MNDIQLLDRAANNIRILSAAMVEKAKSGHPGGAMGAADFINILYSEFLVYDPDNPRWENRDRFFLDPGHMSPMLYSTLALAGKYSMDDLMNFRQWGSITPGHPEIDVEHGIENTSGPLGQGHAFAVGAAIAAKFLKERFGEQMDHTIYTFISDGGIQEEISQGAGRIAGHLGLDNLIMFYDANGVQLSTKTAEVSNENVAAKYKAWGWKVISIDGNNPVEIRGALTDAKEERERPTLIIGTISMGKGAVKNDDSPFEGQTSTHGQPLSQAGASFEKTILNLGGDPQNPFAIFPEVAVLYRQREQQLKKMVTGKNNNKSEWAAKNKEQAGKLAEWFADKIPQIEWNEIEQKNDIATRNASAAVLSVLAQKVENMIVASADLSNSDKTDGFLKYTTAMKKGDFSGAFLQTGVSELTMACLAIGMSLHGGVIPACATFFVFSDYMKPAIRLAALMQQPVKFIWTHDAFRVGEDGPTHQPVEQEAQIRLMEKLKNHHGQNSMLVLRPADAVETTVAWKLAMENNATPTGLILSRQDITDIPVGGNRYIQALQASRGAYIVKDTSDYDIILVASGSEVSTLMESAVLLELDGYECRVVSVPSEGLFRMQDKEYQNDILPDGKKIFGLTAGLPSTLQDLVGDNGKVYGMESFGYSASYKVLDKKLGFTPGSIYREIKAFLETGE
ncbi:MAG: transketolase [Proteiniphilum sp.]